MPAFLIKSRKLHGRIDFRGLSISVENQKGSIRSWYDPNSDEHGMTLMSIPYGYIRLTESDGDGEHVDCFVGPHRDAPMVYIVNQMKSPDFTEHDEQKVFLGMESSSAAKEAYLRHYSDPRFFGSIISIPFEEFREKVMKTRDNGGKPIVKAIDRLAERVVSALLKAKVGDASSLIQAAGGDPNDYDLKEFARGYKVEMEHKDVTGGDPVLTAKIVLAHLAERSNYYSLLEKYVEKAVPGVHLLRKRA